jgi:hypothetical protein
LIWQRWILHIDRSTALPSAIQDPQIDPFPFISADSRPPLSLYTFSSSFVAVQDSSPSNVLLFHPFSHPHPDQLTSAQLSCPQLSRVQPFLTSFQTNLHQLLPPIAYFSIETNIRQLLSTYFIPVRVSDSPVRFTSVATDAAG